jgi:hypothetical protein
VNSNQFENIAVPATHRDPRAIRRGKIIVAVGLIVVMVVAVVNLYLIDRRPGLPDEVDGVVKYDNLSNGIVPGPIDYDRHPPAGGPHDQYAQLCGYYRVPIEDRNAVASLATGAVWIAYRPDLPQTEVDELRDAAEGVLDVLITPYPGLEAPVVMTAWGRQLTLDDPNDERVKLFIYVYQNNARAPQASELCSKGVGLPKP